jgi:SAM-dependent methyltransferase
MDNAVLSRILTMYAPNSGGTQEQLIDTSLRALDAVPDLVAWFLDNEQVFVTAIDEFAGRTPSGVVEQFATAFHRYGSDKSTLHDYHKLYATLLHTKRHLPLRILELGIGTGDLAIMSNMGPNATPGASLRAFESLLPAGTIIGGDIDEAILFNAGRITCVRCDQTNGNGFDELQRAITGNTLDLFIDDGLHAIHANLNSLRFALQHVRPGGHIVIEDIPEKLGWIWKLMASLLGRRHRCSLLRCRSALAFVVGM